MHVTRCSLAVWSILPASLSSAIVALGQREGSIMQINPLILAQVLIAGASGLTVSYVQHQAGGPGNGSVPALLGFAVAWLLIPAIAHDLAKLRRWLDYRFATLDGAAPK